MAHTVPRTFGLGDTVGDGALPSRRRTAARARRRARQTPRSHRPTGGPASSWSPGGVVTCRARARRAEAPCAAAAAALLTDAVTNARPYLVHGLTVSYFTRKVTGYLDHAGLPWRLRGSIGINLAARTAGWNGGIPVVTT